jgi:hypothetical protein
VNCSEEITIVIKPNGKVKVWRKTLERWRGYSLGYLGQGPARSLKLVVWGGNILPWKWNSGICGR